MFGMMVPIWYPIRVKADSIENHVALSSAAIDAGHHQRALPEGGIAGVEQRAQPTVHTVDRQASVLGRALIGSYRVAHRSGRD